MKIKKRSSFASKSYIWIEYLSYEINGLISKRSMRIHKNNRTLKWLILVIVVDIHEKRKINNIQLENVGRLFLASFSNCSNFIASIRCSFRCHSNHNSGRNSRNIAKFTASAYIFNRNVQIQSVFFWKIHNHWQDVLYCKVDKEHKILVSTIMTAVLICQWRWPNWS